MSRAVSELFPHLPDSSRLWIFGVGRPLAAGEESEVLALVDDFLEGWKAHGQPLAAGREWLHGRFLLVAVDDRVTTPSGCSIDALVRSLGSLEERLGTDIIGGAPVWYREGSGEGGLQRLSRADFKKKAEIGLVGPDTIVFDLTLTRLGDLREGKWESRAQESWHRRYLSRPASTP